jgi:hypothetical protein
MFISISALKRQAGFLFFHSWFSKTRHIRVQVCAMSILTGFRVLWAECTVLANHERCVIHCTGTTSVDAVERAMQLKNNEIRLPPGFALHAPILRLQRDSVDTVQLDAELEYTGADVRVATADFVGSVWDLQTGLRVSRGVRMALEIEGPRKASGEGSKPKELGWHTYDLKVDAAATAVAAPRRAPHQEHEQVLGPARHTFNDVAVFDNRRNRLVLGPIRAILDAARATRNLPPLSRLDLIIRENQRRRLGLPIEYDGVEAFAQNKGMEIERQSDPFELADAMRNLQLMWKKLMRFRFKLTCAPTLPCKDGCCDLRFLPVLSVRFVRVMTPGNWTLFLDRDAAGVPCPYNVMVDLAPLATKVDAQSIFTGCYPQENGISFHKREHPALRGRQDCHHVNVLLYGTAVVSVYDTVAGLLFC